MNKSLFEKAVLEKLENGYVDDALDLLNEQWRMEVRGLPSTVSSRTSFGKQPRNDEEQRKIDKAISKFEAMLEAGGIDQALDELNKRWRKEIREAQRQKIYG